MTRAGNPDDALIALQAALAAATAAPDTAAPADAGRDDESEAPLSPRAATANALGQLAVEAAAAYTRGELPGAARVCELLADASFYLVDPVTRPQMLDIAEVCLSTLQEGLTSGEWDVETLADLRALYERIKPADDDAEAIARAMGMTAEEAAAFGLTGNITPVGLDEDEDDGYQLSAVSYQGEDDEEPREQESLETLFRRDARNLVATTLPRALQRYWKNQGSMDALLDVRRGFHTLKGDARVTAQESEADDLEGLAVLAEAAEDIIDELLGDSYDTSVPAPALPAGAFGLLGEAQAFLLKRLDARAALPEEDRFLARLTAMQAKARAATQPSDTSYQLSAISHQQTIAGAQQPTATTVAEGTSKQERAPKQKADSRQLTADRSQRLVATFLSEADKLMPDLHRALARLSSAPDDEGALIRARTRLHTLKGGAALAGAGAADVERLAHGCEDVLELIEDYQLSGSLSVVPTAVLGGVLDAEDALQSLLDDLRETGSSSRGHGGSVAPLPRADVDGLLDRLATLKEQVVQGEETAPDESAAPDAAPAPLSAPTLNEDVMTIEAVQAAAGAPARGDGEEEHGLALITPLPQADAAWAPHDARADDEESSEERRLQMALRALEDQQMQRDALEHLLGAMTTQALEARRANTRLRDLVARVEHELAGLRTELARTTGRAGEWDALEKEEYTTMDVLVMQLDEALADQKDAATRLSGDLAEARAQVEQQGESLLRAQRALLDLGMVPLAHLEARLEHTVRSVSRRLNKNVTFALDGGAVTLDRHIAESLFNPLMLLISNAVDHGIEERAADRAAAGKPEEGRITVRGRSVGDGVAVSIEDDGRGIDPDRIVAVAVSKGIVSAEHAASMTREERIALIWAPGFSTAKRVGTVSGRGMGMKSVQDDVAALHGQISVETEVGKGTIYTITLPRSLAMMRVQIVREGEHLVGIPITGIERTYAVAYDSVAGGLAGRSVMIGDRALEVYPAHLSAGPAGDGPNGLGILLQASGRDGGILVDEVVASRYIPVRPAPAHLRRLCGLLGYALGSAGAILPIVQVETVIARAQEAPAPAAPAVEDGVEEQERHVVLVVDDSQTMRRALSQTFGKAGFLVQQAASGYDALTVASRSMPAVVTLDMEMPGMDGLETLSALRRMPGGASIPVFMVTSRQQGRHRAAALAAGVTRYFTKPYDGDELVGAARVAIAEGLAAPEAAS